MKLPKTVTTVTPFSKLMAIVLFILFAVFGFYIGTAYQKNISGIPPTGTCTGSITCNGPMLPAGCKFLPSVDSCSCPTQYVCPGITPTISIPRKACPLVAKQCPDGSFVTPQGPDCRMPDCPASSPNK